MTRPLDATSIPFLEETRSEPESRYDRGPLVPLGAFEDASRDAGRLIGGRYTLERAFASGGTATVHLGMLVGAGGFTRRVAIKRLHPHVAEDPAVRTMLLNEARLVSRISHPNVVEILDVVEDAGDVYVVLEFVEGEALSGLLGETFHRGTPVPIGIAVAVVVQALRGLHAAHEATGANGKSLEIVHRDVSPQNVLVGSDGLVRVIDFGIARAAGVTPTTVDGSIKGKIAYMAPEQLLGDRADRRADLYAAGVMLWEMLAGERLHGRLLTYELAISRVRNETPPRAPSACRPEVPAELDAVVMRALAAAREERFATANEMADALAGIAAAAPSELGAWVRELAGPRIDLRVRGGAARAARAEETTEVLGPEEPLVPTVLVSPPAARSRSTTEITGTPVEGVGLVANADPAPAATESSPAAPAARSRRGLVAVLAISFLLAVGGLLARGALGGSREAAPAPSASSGAASVNLATGASALAPPSGGPSAALAPLIPPPAGAAVPSDAPAGPPTKVRPTRRGPAATAAPDCKPPYVVDPSGVRRYKAECL